MNIRLEKPFVGAHEPDLALERDELRVVACRAVVGGNGPHRQRAQVDLVDGAALGAEIRERPQYRGATRRRVRNLRHRLPAIVGHDVAPGLDVLRVGQVRNESAVEQHFAVRANRFGVIAGYRHIGATRPRVRGEVVTLEAMKSQSSSTVSCTGGPILKPPAMLQSTSI